MYFHQVGGVDTRWIRFVLNLNFGSDMYHVIDIMVMAMTPNPHTTPISTFCIVFHIFIVVKHS